MGLYINHDSGGRGLQGSFEGKCSDLEADGAVKISSHNLKFQEGLVCVVDNRFFAAAGYAYSEREMEEFLNPEGRQTQWYVYKYAKALAR